MQMGSQSKPQTLQALIDSVPNIVDYLYRNPPKSALNVFGVMMPSEVVRPEYTTWRDEQRSWRETVALHDQSYHMHSLYVRGLTRLTWLSASPSTASRTLRPAPPSRSLPARPGATSSATASSTTSTPTASFSSATHPPPTGRSSTPSGAASM